MIDANHGREAGAEGAAAQPLLTCPPQGFWRRGRNKVESKEI